MHVGFIMNGNRRWAVKHGWKKIMGYPHGGDVLENMIEVCSHKKIDVISFWGLAKKNIEKRPPEEVNVIYDLLVKKITSIEKKLHKKQIRFFLIGDDMILRDDIVTLLRKLEKDTKTYTKMQVCLLLGYGGQDEIIHGIKNIINSGIDVNTLNEQTFAQYLWSGVVPPPDLIIRTGGEHRHSGYFLYSSEYAEYFYTKKYWPEFREKDLDEALGFFSKTPRNFGK